MPDQEEYIPATLIECFELVRQEVEPGDWEKLSNRSDGRFHDFDHNMGWGIYLRNRFLHPQHSPVRAKLEQIVISFDADPISGLMFEWLWMFAKEQNLEATDLRAKLDEFRVANVIREMCGLCPIRDLELDQFENLLGQRAR